MQVSPSKVFRRQGPDVHSDAEITIAQAALGGTLRLAGIHHEMELVVSTFPHLGNV